MQVTSREYGAGPDRPRGAGGRQMGLVILAAPPPPGALPEPVVEADLAVDAALLARAAREPGPPAPLVPPIPIDKARELAAALAARGLAVRVYPADSWARLVLRAPTVPEALGEARAQALAFIVRGGEWEPERHSLDAVLRELCDNAARHGNRNDPDRTVEVDVLIDDARLAIAVTDQGDGFDTGGSIAQPVAVGARGAPAGGPGEGSASADAAPGAPAAREALARAEARFRRGERGGLGLMMIAGWADSLSFRAGGRTAVVEKRAARA